MGHACSGLGVKSDFTSGQAIPSLGSYGHPNICRRPCILICEAHVKRAQIVVSAIWLTMLSKSSVYAGCKLM